MLYYIYIGRISSKYTVVLVNIYTVINNIIRSVTNIEFTGIQPEGRQVNSSLDFDFRFRV